MEMKSGDPGCQMKMGSDGREAGELCKQGQAGFKTVTVYSFNRSKCYGKFPFSNSTMNILDSFRAFEMKYHPHMLAVMNYPRKGCAPGTQER